MAGNEAQSNGAAIGKSALFQLLRDGRPRTRAILSAETGQPADHARLGRLRRQDVRR